MQPRLPLSSLYLAWYLQEWPSSTNQGRGWWGTKRGTGWGQQAGWGVGSAYPCLLGDPECPPGNSPSSITYAEGKSRTHCHPPR